MVLANITYYNLQYFSVVYEERNLSRAADRICISRQALSKSIALMEKNLGKVLFKRKQNGVEPTNAARELIPHVRMILREYDSFFMRGQIEELNTRRVRACTVDAVSQVFPNSFYEKFYEKYPNVILSIEEKNEEYAIQQLQAGKCDFAIVSQHSNYRDFQFHHLFYAEFGSYMSVNHPLARKDILRLDDFKRIPFVGKTMDLDYYSQAVADIYKKKLELDFFLEMTNSGKCRDLVREGKFVSFDWNYTLFNNINDGVNFRPVPEMGDGIDLYLITNKNTRFQTKNAVLFQKFLSEWLSEQKQEQMVS